jgi:hypothetical protein
MESNFSLYNFSGIVSDNVTHGTSLMRIPPTFNEAFMTRTIILGIMFLMALVGNTATIIQMYRMRKRRSTINTLIVNYEKPSWSTVVAILEP